MSIYPAEASHDCPLFEYGATAAETRAAAFTVSLPRQSARRQLALIVLRKAREHGHTRESWGEAMNLKVQSLCQPALDLLRDGLAVETGERRRNSSGAFAAVIVASEFAGRHAE